MRTGIKSRNFGGDISVTGNGTQIVRNKITTPLQIKGNYANIEGNILLEEVTTVGAYISIIENSFSDTISSSGACLNISSNNWIETPKSLPADWCIHLEGSFCVISDNSLTVIDLDFGIDVAGNENIVATNSLDNNGVGIVVAGAGNIVCANRLANNQVGLEAAGNNTIYANYLANNEIGVTANLFQVDAVSVFFHNDFINNTHQVATDNKDRDIFGNDDFDDGKVGNYWSNYAGEDADGDGIGNTPYVIDAKRQDNYPLTVPFDIESVTTPLPDWASSESKASEPFPVASLLAAFVSIIAIVGVGLLVYFRKRKRLPSPAKSNQFLKSRGISYPSTILCHF